MKYEFLVGDYVETKDGRVGYITQVAFTNEVKRWCFMRIMRRQIEKINELIEAVNRLEEKG